jgi:predicted dehydrogenase
LAVTEAAAAELLQLADREGVRLFCDHTYCFTQSAIWIARAIAQGLIGELHWFDSVRINLGLVQPDVDVLFDLAPHDLSLLDFFFPADAVEDVFASVSDPIGAGKACVAHLDLRLRSGVVGHLHVNWLSPTKVRRLVLAGSEGVIVWDDVSHSQRVSVFDAGVEIVPPSSIDLAEKRQVNYRMGSVFAPALEEREAIETMIASICRALATGDNSPADASSGVTVLRVIEAAELSAEAGGWQRVGRR